MKDLGVSLPDLKNVQCDEEHRQRAKQDLSDPLLQYPGDQSGKWESHDGIGLHYTTIPETISIPPDRPTRNDPEIDDQKNYYRNSHGSISSQQGNTSKKSDAHNGRVDEETFPEAEQDLEQMRSM